MPEVLACFSAFDQEDQRVFSAPGRSRAKAVKLGSLAGPAPNRTRLSHDVSLRRPRSPRHARLLYRSRRLL
jgi:hypothetical protein